MNADAGILDGKLGDLMVVTHPECHVAGVGEFDRVGQKIDQNLPQPIFVGLNHDRQAPGADMAEFDALGGRLQAEHGDDLIEKVAELHFVAAQVKPPGLDLRDIEQSVDQSGQMLGAAPHYPDGIESRLRDGGIALEELRIAEDGVEWGAQLMAQADDMTAFCRAGRFGHFLGFLQLGVGALVRLDLVHQQIGLPARLLFGYAAAFLRENEQPGGYARDDDQNEENGPQRRYQDFARSFHVECDQKIDQRQNGADHADKKRQARRDSGRHGCSEA